MKTFVLATALVAAILVNAVSVQAAPKSKPIDGVKFFEDIANRGGG